MDEENNRFQDNSPRVENVPEPASSGPFSEKPSVKRPKRRIDRIKNYLILILLAALIILLTVPSVKDVSITGAISGLFAEEKAWVGFEEGSPFLGNPDAPVKVIVFSDFQCPYCAKLANEAVYLIKEEYVKTGAVKLIFKHMPLDFHNLAEPASIASMCAGKQGKFWEYHDKLFENQGQLSDTYFKTLANELEVNMDEFNRCFMAGEPRGQIILDKQAASAAEVRGTPAVLINGELIFGAQPYSAFKEVIERKLNDE